MNQVIKRDPEIDEIAAQCSVSIEKHCLQFHGERFDVPFSQRHYELFEIIDDVSIQKVLVIAHRGFGKTSLFNYGLPSQHIVFPEVKGVDFVVSVSASATQAVMQSENLKMELQANPMVRTLIGDIKSDSFSKDVWVTSNGVMVLPRGSGQQIRGILFRNSRPGLIIVDDLEDSEEVMSADQRKKLKQWFLTDLINCVDRSKSDWRIIVVGTVLHEAALLEDLRVDSSWVTLDFPLCDEGFKSYWPARFSDERIGEIVSEYREQDFIEGFYLEYMNIANPREDAVFRPEFFKYYDEAEVKLSEDPNVETFVIVDPAKTAKQHSAFTAIVGVGVDRVNNLHYVREIVNARLAPNEIYKETFDMAERLKVSVIGIEITGLNEFIRQPFLDEMLRRGRVYEVVELKARKGEGDYAARGRGKEGRVAALAPYYRLGRILHNKACCGVLELQLLNFPKARHWDVMDALAYMIEMKEIGGLYFEEEHDEKDEDWNNLEEKERLEREYEKLMAEDEPAIPESVFAVV